MSSQNWDSEKPRGHHSTDLSEEFEYKDDPETTQSILVIVGTSFLIGCFVGAVIIAMAFRVGFF